MKKEYKAVVVGPDSSETENKEASESKYNLVFTSPKALRATASKYGESHDSSENSDFFLLRQ